MFQETADEGQGGADLDNNSVVVTLTTASNANTSLQQHPQAPPVVHSPPSTTSNNPLTVKDLMLGVIEMQLKRNPNSPAGTGGLSVPVNSGTPTISSILKTDHRNDITFVREYKPSSSSIASNTAMSNRGESNLATLSVVSSHHSHHRSAPSPQQMGKFSTYILFLSLSQPLFRITRFNQYKSNILSDLYIYITVIKLILVRRVT